MVVNQVCCWDLMLESILKCVVNKAWVWDFIHVLWTKLFMSKNLSKRAIKGFWSKQVTMPCADKDAANNPKPQAAKPSQQCMLHHAFSCGQCWVAHPYLRFTCTTHNCSTSKQRASFSLARVGGQVVPKHPVSLPYLLVFGRRHGSSKQNSLSRDQKLENECEKLVDEKCEQCMYPFPYTQKQRFITPMTKPFCIGK